MSELHPAARGFAAAELYERGRPGYPPAAIRHIVSRLDLRPGQIVLDLAAGTGKLTRLLVPSGATVLAVEPLPEMRAALTRLVPGVTPIEGSAERLPLADGAVGAVTVGQAFHWFRPTEALREIRRVLQPRGGLALIWNRRDERDPLQAALSKLIDPLAGEAPRHRRADWAALLDGSGLFSPCETACFAHSQTVDEEGLVGRVLSISFVATAPSAVRDDVERRVRALAAAQEPQIRLPYVSELYLAFRDG